MPLPDPQLFVGTKQHQSDILTPSLLTRWYATLDRSGPADTVAPQGIHWCLTTPELLTGQLQDDGHRSATMDANVFPPAFFGLPRRMWASSTVKFLQPLAVGVKIERKSRVSKVTEKNGSSGDMIFVEIDHDIFAGEILAMCETQTIVFLPDRDSTEKLSPPAVDTHSFTPQGWDEVDVFTPQDAHLFRYSALTFNAHKIHLDMTYCQAIERYRDLVVQGPLIATLLLRLAADKFGPNKLTSFAFRATSPAMVQDDLNLVMRGEAENIELAAYANDGRQIMQAQAAIS